MTVHFCDVGYAVLEIKNSDGQAGNKTIFSSEEKDYKSCEG